MELHGEDSAASEEAKVTISSCAPLARELVRLLDVSDSQRAKPSDRAILLADAGRREEALAQVEQNQTEFPDDVWVEIKGGDAHLALGNTSEAEALYRKALGRADMGYDREGVLERLLPLLHDQGRGSEADRLQAEEQQRRYSEALAYRTIASPTVRRDEPKIGRNDACACGCCAWGPNGPSPACPGCFGTRVIGALRDGPLRSARRAPAAPAPLAPVFGCNWVWGCSSQRLD